MRSAVSLLAVLSLPFLALRASAGDVVAPAASAEAGSGAAPASASAAASAPGLGAVAPIPALSSSLLSAPAAFSAPAPTAAAARAAVPTLAPAAASAAAVPAAAVPTAAAVSAPAAEPTLPEAVPSAAVRTAAASATTAVTTPAAAATRFAPSEMQSRGGRTMRFAAAIARALSFGKTGDASLPATSAAAPIAPAASGLSAASAASAPRSAAVDAIGAAAPVAAPVAGKRSFMAGTFVYNLATSVMLVVQQALFFALAQADQLARGYSSSAAGLHAAGIVFALATVTGAMRIPGNSLGAWLSARTDQRNLSVISSGARAAILASVAALVFFHHIGLPLAALLYSADWLIGGLEEVSRNTQTPALVKPGTTEFKSWSTLSQFLAQLTGLFGPLFVIALSQFKGLDAAGHVLAPLMFVGAALLYARIPADAFHRGSAAAAAAAAAAPQTRVSRVDKWRAFVADRSLFLPALALALMSVLLLKGPLSLNMASLLLAKSGASLVTYSALLSGLFGAGLGAGTWIAHVSKGGEAARRAPARWLALAALSTVALAGSWAFGASPLLALPAIAAAWFFFALANAAGQALLMHGLQERVAAAGSDKKYAVGLTLTMANALITVLRVLAGLIFFVAAKNWQTAFGLFGGLMLLVAAGQWALARRMGRPARAH